MKIFFSKHPISGQVAMIPSVLALKEQGHIHILNEEVDGSIAATTADIVVLSSAAEYGSYRTERDSRTFCFVSRSPQTVHTDTHVGDLATIAQFIVDRANAEARIRAN